MIWLRIDNRLIHGQVIETWIPYLKTWQLVVANDCLVMDSEQQHIVRLAIPKAITAFFVSVAGTSDLLASLAPRKINTLVVVAECQDARMIIEQGGCVDMVNVGNLHYAPGKEQMCSHAALSSHDILCLDFIFQRAIPLDFRCVPNDSGKEISRWIMRSRLP